MAEQVELCVEQWVGPLHDLLQLGVFSKKEIDQIVETRRNQEYKMKHLTRTGKTDLYRKATLQAIQYEIALDLLRKERLDSRKIDKKITESSLAGVRRINALFRRLCHKCPTDAKVWLQYLDFLLRSGQTKQLKEVSFQALRHHSRNPQLWLLAIRREAEEGNFEATRSLFVRSLRFLPKDVQLLKEYFKWELKHGKRKADLLQSRAKARDPQHPPGTETGASTLLSEDAAKVLRPAAVVLTGCLRRNAAVAADVLPYIEACGAPVCNLFATSVFARHFAQREPGRSACSSSEGGTTSTHPEVVDREQAKLMQSFVEKYAPLSKNGADVVRKETIDGRPCPSESVKEMEAAFPVPALADEVAFADLGQEEEEESGSEEEESSSEIGGAESVRGLAEEDGATMKKNEKSSQADPEGRARNELKNNEHSAESSVDDATSDYTKRQLLETLQRGRAAGSEHSKEDVSDAEEEEEEESDSGAISDNDLESSANNRVEKAGVSPVDREDLSDEDSEAASSDDEDEHLEPNLKRPKFLD
ncbi:unnamed protein product [Amoebophrya sp. A120]|nr:unnamed protein product [Amoebophrya sp. A120]|eukprot:GSA120T00002587001.1